MIISVFTPIHKKEPDKLRELYESLRAQTRPPDEWVILLNGDALSPEMKDFPGHIVPTNSAVQTENWIKIFTTDTTANIGALKGECCDLATGDILVEVDYDDQLTPDALEEIENAFSFSDIQYVYSNCVEYREDGNCNTYGEQYGWQSRPFGTKTQIVAFPPSAQYLRRIEWAPNHVRAFRAEAYRQVGGYDKTIKVGDDHDLICRFYIQFGEHGFQHIDDCLYLYRVHAGNTCNGNNLNADIQKQVDVNYCTHAEDMYRRWALDNALLCLDLGGRIACPEGYASVDLLDADFIQDLNETWRFNDNSVGVLRAYHVLEHLNDTIHFFNEAFRVLAPGGFLLIEVPSANGAGAFGDPTHKKFFNLLSFEYFTNQQYAKYIQPQYTGRFQVARLVEYWWQNPNIPIISAQLIALKGWYDQCWCGEKKI